jgi:hypothetical protein
MIAILLIAVALVAIALILLWGLRSIHSWQAEIVRALRDIACQQSPELAEDREEGLLRLAEQELMAPLPPEGKVAAKVSGFKVVPKTDVYGENR